MHEPLPSQCWIHAHPASAPWLQDAMGALRGVPHLEVRLLRTWPESAAEPASAHPDVVVLDASDVGQSCRALRAFRTVHGRCPALVVTSTLESRLVQQLTQAGADDFMATPIRAEELALRVRRSLGLWPERSARHGHQGAVQESLRECGLVGEHPAFLAQIDRVRRIADTDVSVLLLGETGTGKELFAQAVHYHSGRASGPWVAVNCGALPAELVESELFGHVKGAYTHAVSSRPGLVRQASGGTLFLDEVNSLPLAAQTKLLRFLQDKEVRPVGASVGQSVDVRVIAASNQDLAELAARGAFRLDLYYRLNVVSMLLPPLRERRSDIPALALLFLHMFATRFARHVDALTPGALRVLIDQPWPGNVRELMHVIERAVVLSDGSVLDTADLDLPGTSAAGGTAPASMRNAKARIVSDFERSYIQQLLAEHGGNITQAARAAQKNRRAFFALMRKYHLGAEPAAPRGPSS
jgi:two-component system, NtrC family, response regulator GlrR